MFGVLRVVELDYLRNELEALRHPRVMDSETETGFPARLVVAVQVEFLVWVTDRPLRAIAVDLALCDDVADAIR